MSRIVISIFDDLHNPYYGGGGAVVVHEVARRLAREHDVTVVAGSYASSRSYRAWGVNHVYLPAGWAGPRGGQLVFHLLLPLVALTRRYDLWIESFTPPHSTSLLPLFSRGRPVIGWAQMLAGKDMSRRYRLPFAWMERRGLAAYKRVIVLNRIDRGLVLRSNARADVSMIPNGVVLPELTPSPGGDHILFLGRIDVKQKGLDLLLDAHAAAPNALPLVIAGSGTAAQEQLLRSLLLGNDRVRLVGHATGVEKEALLRGCAFVVMPSRFETFGLSALEGMAYGKPVVAFDLPQIDWIVGDCAVRVPPLDVGALAAAMERLSLDLPYRAALGARARATAQGYDWDDIVGQYQAVLDVALSATRAPRRGGTD